MTADEIQEMQDAATQEAAAATTPYQFNSTADFDARLMQMMKADADKRLAEDLERQRKQQVAQAMGDLGHVLIDTIKASGGALVTPRDVTARYQAMDAQNQKIYDNYRARMDVISAQQLALNKERRAAEDAERQRQAQANIWDKRIQAQKDIAGENNETKEAIARIRAEGQIKAAQTAANARVRVAQDNAGKQTYYVPFMGSEYPIDKNAYDGRMCAVYAYLKNNNLFPETSGYGAETNQIFALLNSNNASQADETSRWKLTSAVNVALQSDKFSDPSSPHVANIIAILRGGRPAAAPASSTTTANNNDNSGGGRLSGNKRGAR